LKFRSHLAYNCSGMRTIDGFSGLLCGAREAPILALGATGRSHYQSFYTREKAREKQMPALARFNGSLKTSRKVGLIIRSSVGQSGFYHRRTDHAPIFREMGRALVKNKTIASLRLAISMHTLAKRILVALVRCPSRARETKETGTE